MNDIWDILPHPRDHVVRLFAKSGETRSGDYARNQSEFDRFVSSNLHANIYVAPNPTRCTTGIRHSAEDVTHWSFLFFDVDPVQEPSDPRAALAEILNIFGGWAGQNLEKNHPTIIDSGRGVQAWLRLEDIDLTAEGVIERKNIRKLMSFWLRRIASRVGLIHGCKLDTSCSDLPRLMRIPGTRNIKTGNFASIITTQKAPYNWLAPFLIAGCPEETFRENEHAPMPGVPWQVVFTKLTPTAQEFIHRGKEEPGRHSTIWHVAKSLQELGIDRVQARAALNLGNTRRGDENALSRKDIEHALDTAFGYEDRA